MLRLKTWKARFMGGTAGGGEDEVPLGGGEDGVARSRRRERERRERERERGKGSRAREEGILIDGVVRNFTRYPLSASRRASPKLDTCVPPPPLLPPVPPPHTHTWPPSSPASTFPVPAATSSPHPPVSRWTSTPTRKKIARPLTPATLALPSPFSPSSTSCTAKTATRSGARGVYRRKSYRTFVPAVSLRSPAAR